MDEDLNQFHASQLLIPPGTMDLSVVEIDFSQPSDFYFNSSDPSKQVMGKVVDFKTISPTVAGMGSNTILDTWDVHIGVSKYGLSDQMLFVKWKQNYATIKIPNSQGGSWSPVFAHTGINGSFSTLPIRAEMEVKYYSGTGTSLIASPVTLIGTGPNAITYEAVELREVAHTGNTYADNWFDSPGSGGQNRKWLYLSFYGSTDPAQMTNSICGMEFSRNGDWLFVLTREAPYMYAVPMNSGALANTPINQTGTNIVNMTSVSSASSVLAGYKGSQIENGRDGRTYIQTTPDQYITFDANTFPTINWTTVPINFNFYAEYTEGNPILSQQWFDPGSPNQPYDLYLMVDQMDDNFYLQDIHEVDDACCKEGVVYDILYKEISSNTVWDANSNPWGGTTGRVKDRIIVKSGSILTIDGLTLEFAEEAKLIVERGARLRLTNSTLTSITCEGVMWQGVEAWGTQGTSHSGFVNPDYGWISMSNSTIENAYNGITTGKRLANGSFDINYSGGLITGTNSLFLNNQRDVDMPPFITQFFNFSFNAQNKSFFNNCEFQTTSQLKDPGVFPLQHVRMVQNTGVKFRANTFENTVPLQFNNINTRGTGIAAFDSHFYVTYKCSSIPPAGSPCPQSARVGNTFSNLNYGINAISANQIYSCVIENSDFSTNFRGIRLVGMLGPVVHNNKFDAGTSGTPSGLSQSYAAYMQNCTQYFFQNNDFTSTPDNDYGLVVVNSGELDNEVRNNSFEDFKYASTASLINHGTVVSGTPGEDKIFQGLQFLCNDYSNTEFVDIQVPSGGIRDQQGDLVLPSVPDAETYPANNVFTIVEPTAGHFTLDPLAEESNYNYSGINNGFEIEPSPALLNLPSPASKSPVTNVGYDPIASCPEEKPFNANIGNILLYILTKKQAIADLIDQIDGGSTDNLVNDIRSGLPAGQLKNLLLSVSPYLSDEVLIEYIHSNPPAGHLKQVILANSPVSEDVLSALDNIFIPNGIANQIEAAQDGSLSAMDVLLNDASRLTAEKNSAFDQRFRTILHDTAIVNKADSLIQLLHYDYTKERMKTKVSIYLASGQFTDAEILLDSILTEHPQEEDFAKLQEQLITIYSCSDKAYRIESDSVVRTKLEEVAYSGTKRECNNAGALLELLKLLDQPELLEVVSPPPHSPILTEETVEKDQNLLLYPNPGNGYVNLVLPEIAGDVIVTIRDASGKIVQSLQQNDTDYVLLNVSNLAKGLYHIEVIKDGETSSIKLAVK